MLNVIIIAIVILNIISILILLKMLSGLNNTFKIVITIALIAVNLILSNIIYSIGQVGTLAEEISNVVKTMTIFTLFPINAILMLCPIAILINKWKSVEINKEQLIKRIIIFFVIDIVIIILECMYIKTNSNWYY